MVSVRFKKRPDGAVQPMAYPSEHEAPPPPPSVASDGPIVHYLKCTTGESLFQDGDIDRIADTESQGERGRAWT